VSEEERSDRNRQRWRRRLSGYAFALLVLATLGVLAAAFMTR
jgi:hypothetical protein